MARGALENGRASCGRAPGPTSTNSEANSAEDDDEEAKAHLFNIATHADWSSGRSIPKAELGLAWSGDRAASRTS
ncbi:hypothetical protein GX51_06120 [Blastomyces parvus]|uniref:Uncharacterized protein n=1 Tax=Blastomyces parvus TaxID=2060905 RepID=A0A2B7WTA9_9EURO|nr:hypothetical protein GX51_06120 [Blastomyces parvus]